MTGPVEASVAAVATEKGSRFAALVSVAEAQHSAPSPTRLSVAVPCRRDGDRQDDQRDTGQKACENIQNGRSDLRAWRTDDAFMQL
jgi:hypothetical protein